MQRGWERGYGGVCSSRKATERGHGVHKFVQSHTGRIKRACGAYDCKKDGERGYGVCARMSVNTGRQKKEGANVCTVKGESGRGVCKQRKVGGDL